MVRFNRTKTQMAVTTHLVDKLEDGVSGNLGASEGELLEGDETGVLGSQSRQRQVQEGEHNDADSRAFGGRRVRIRE